MQTSEELLEEAAEQLPYIGHWMSIAIPIMIEMHQRLRQNPAEPRFCEILLPGTNDPAFTEDQALQLEDAFREVQIIDQQLEEEEEEEKAQVGGGVVTPEMEDAAKTIGAVRRSLMGLLDADNFSPDAWYAKFKQFLRHELPALAKVVKDMAEMGGLTRLETVLPDVHGVIPLPVGAIPFQIPSMMIIPLLAAFLDTIRFTISVVPFVGTLSSLPFTLLLALIELGKGRLYDFLLTLLGLIGTNGIVLGISAKVVLGSLVLLEPALKEIPDEVFDSGYRATKAAILAFILKFAATVTPDQIRLPLTTFTETIKQAARTYDMTVRSTTETVSKSTQDKVHLEMQLIDVNQIPSFMDILSVQRLFQNPAFITYPGVIDIIEQLRSIPPLPLIVDLFNVPRKSSEEFQAMLATYPPGSIAESFVPHLKIKDPNTGQYVDLKDVKESTFANVAKAKGLPTSLGDITSLGGLPTDIKGAAGAVGLPTTAEGVASAVGLPTLPTTAEGVAGAVGLPTLPTLPTLPKLPKKGGTRKNKTIRIASRRNRF